MKRASIIVPSMNLPHVPNRVKEYLENAGWDNYELLLLAHNPREGFAKTVNRGLKMASGDVLVIMSDNNETKPGWLKAVMEEIGEFSLAGTEASRGNGFGHKCFSLWFAAFPMSVLETVGFLDEKFNLYFEDDDFGHRCELAGVNFQVVASGMVSHPEAEKSTKTIANKLELWKESEAYYKEKWRL